MPNSDLMNLIGFFKGGVKKLIVNLISVLGIADISAEKRKNSSYEYACGFINAGR